MSVFPCHVTPCPVPNSDSWSRRGDVRFKRSKQRELKTSPEVVYTLNKPYVSPLPRRHITLSHVCLTLTVARGPHLLSSIQGFSPTLPTTPKSIRVIFNHRISSFNKTPQAPVANCGHYQSHLSHYCIQKKKSILFAACSENAPQI